MTPADSARIEAALQRLVTAYIAAGLAFLLLPGTFPGVWNLVFISGRYSLESLPAAWMQAHGHAQIFGWISTFIIGIGSYSLSKMSGQTPASALLELAAFLIFFVTVSRHKKTGSGPARFEPWMKAVVASTSAFLLVLLFNFTSAARSASSPRSRPTRRTSPSPGGPSPSPPSRNSSP
jgi:hypothetical protein